MKKGKGGFYPSFPFFVSQEKFKRGTVHERIPESDF